MILIEQCTEATVKHVASNLCIEDEREVLTVSGLPVQDAIQFGVNVATDSFAVHPVFEGRPDAPVALFGVVEDKDPEFGVIWMMTTPMLLRTSRDILKTAPQWFDGWLSRFPKGLHNLVDTRNEKHIKWLQKLGAKFNPNYHVIRDVPFAYFHIARA